MKYDKVPPLATWIFDSTSRPRSNAVVARPPIPSAPIPRAALPRTSGQFKEVDTLIELYHKAFQPMSKRNVLSDLETELQQRFVNLSPRENEAVEALKEVVKRELASMPVTRRYDKVVCIGWNVGCNYNKSTGKTDPTGKQNPDYFRHDERDQADMMAKCAEMWHAISEARKIIDNRDGGGLAPRHRKTTLKIFMAPEFYFRGKNGAYSTEIVSKIIPNMQQLGTSSSEYEDWLFIFGTAVEAIEIEKTYCQTCNAFSVKFVPNPADKTKTVAQCIKNASHKIGIWKYGAEIQNIALVQKGKETARVAKEYISGIDYTNFSVKIHPGTSDERDAGVLHPGGSKFDIDHPTKHPDQSQLVTQNDERLGGCRLTIDGIKIAVEICLDHAAIGGKGRATALEGSTQILLIPSYGMSIGDGLYCVPGGVAFNVDGQKTGTTEVKVKGQVGSETLHKHTLSKNARGTTIQFSNALAIPNA